MSKPSAMKTILIVDHGEHDPSVSARELHEEGYTTHLLSSGVKALQFVNKYPHVNASILDIKMAPLDGIQILAQLPAKSILEGERTIW